MLLKKKKIKFYLHCMCKQQNFAINFLDFIVKRKIKYCNKYTVIIEIWIWYAVWWNEKNS